MKNEKWKTSWISPSNIALVKYWGKKPVQIPANPSLSMTLNKAYTEMTVDVSHLKVRKIYLTLIFILKERKTKSLKLKSRTFYGHYLMNSRNWENANTGFRAETRFRIQQGLLNPHPA